MRDFRFAAPTQAYDVSGNLPGDFRVDPRGTRRGRYSTFAASKCMPSRREKCPPQ
jgi:hypothetical protein